MTKLNRLVVVSFIVMGLVCASVPVSAVEEGEAKQFWDQCLIKISPKCTLDIVEGIFGNGTVADSCCPELIQEGKLCYDILTNYIADRPIYISRRTEFLKKRDDLWTHCGSASKTA
ncbi:PREDICTED: uncharacterized protein LOC104824180 [Tarenaya hassleriana]|uniref:uncharacterized protein LOC104824180 n=1 Tax=Tarenaya hassleriana TaxID=28532 RepID=UPI00053C297B|nr:PREDICTED: uncharacterized protein LOC104824180 [Tarenaya hassleriana]